MISPEDHIGSLHIHFFVRFFEHLPHLNVMNKSVFTPQSHSTVLSSIRHNVLPLHICSRWNVSLDIKVSVQFARKFVFFSVYCAEMIRNVLSLLFWQDKRAVSPYDMFQWWSSAKYQQKELNRSPKFNVRYQIARIFLTN